MDTTEGNKDTYVKNVEGITQEQKMDTQKVRNEKHKNIIWKDWDLDKQKS